MSDFVQFAQLVSERWSLLQRSNSELYVADVPNIYDQYLASFPEGSNPVFRERSENDCNTCKQFIRTLGKVVAIDGDTVLTVWDVPGLPGPYGAVAETMGALVRNAKIESVFRTKEPQYGHEKNADNHDSSIVWYHLWGKIETPFHISNPDTIKGQVASKVQVFKRSLEELTPESLEAVLDLIEQNSLYRGAEFKRQVTEFKQQQADYAFSSNKDRFAWARAPKLNVSVSNIRNTAIGTLLVDLSEGRELEAAVASYEAKVAPHNYKRTTALITETMIKKAVQTLEDLGLESAINRRLAKIEDLSVNDVLFVDNSVSSKMRNSLESALLGSSSIKKTAKKIKEATKISIKDLLSLGASTIEVLLENTHISNFVALTAPVEKNVEPLFKWNNNFAWSYDGEVADSMRELVVSRGGRVDGVFRFTHQWNYGKRNASLMDLHVFGPGCNPENHRDGCHDNYPSGLRVGWNRRVDPKTGGVQDVDYTPAAPADYVPIENITFPNLGNMPEGTYVCKIHNWGWRPPTQGGFKAEIEFEGQVFEYEVDRPLKQKEWITVAVVTLKNGKFSIEHKLPTASSSKEKWGVATYTPVKVQTILNSPNHWENAGGSGNKHWFFILEGCRVDAPARGIYNEFLRADLNEHRKVFEVLGSKTKCEPTPEHLAGVGFSETRKDTIKVIADGRPYEVQF